MKKRKRIHELVKPVPPFLSVGGVFPYESALLKGIEDLAEYTSVGQIRLFQQLLPRHADSPRCQRSENLAITDVLLEKRRDHRVEFSTQLSIRGEKQPIYALRNAFPLPKESPIVGHAPEDHVERTYFLTRHREPDVTRQFFAFPKRKRQQVNLVGDAVM